jgi:multidrug transporter EmrE-like cation transporter
MTSSKTGRREYTAMKWVYLLIAVSGEIAATSALKASEGFTN